jgi:hypothetical protein
MPAIEALAAILGIIVAALTIARTFSRPKVNADIIEGSFEEVVKPASGRPAPALSRAEFDRLAATMPVEWVVYEGATPPLKLKIRGATDAMHRQSFRKHLAGIGEEAFHRLTFEQQRAITRAVNAELYVLDWDGAHYANGNKIPFSAPSLELMLQKDPDLDAFLSGQARRINPSPDV